MTRLETDGVLTAAQGERWSAQRMGDDIVINLGVTWDGQPPEFGGTPIEPADLADLAAALDEFANQQ